MKAIKLIVFIFGCIVIQSHGAEIKYKSFIVNPHERPNLKYEYSEALATLEDPVRIYAVGRTPTEEDQANRVDLQKVWLRNNVPADFEYGVRSIYQCKIKLNPDNLCDGYIYRNKKTNKEIEFYILVGVQSKK